MKSSEQVGFYLFSKTSGHSTSLKEMLQYLRFSAPGKSLQFAYVESETSLLPHLTLWENLHVVIGGSSWKEFTASLHEEWKPLVNLIRDPNMTASEASSWERLTVALIKATLIKTDHLLIDINEESYSPLNLRYFKKILMSLSVDKNVYISTAKSTEWMDSAHSFISRENYQFVLTDLRVPKKTRIA